MKLLPLGIVVGSSLALLLTSCGGDTGGGDSREMAGAPAKEPEGGSAGRGTGGAGMGVGGADGDGGTSTGEGGTPTSRGGAQNGGAPSRGGAQNGGAQNGGAQNGGAQNGGTTALGGAENAGGENGGAENGGAASAGAENGGAADGGMAGGGAAGALNEEGGQAGAGQGGSSGGGAGGMAGDGVGGWIDGGCQFADVTGTGTVTSIEVGTSSDGTLCNGEGLVVRYEFSPNDSTIDPEFYGVASYGYDSDRFQRLLIVDVLGNYLPPESCLTLADVTMGSTFSITRKIKIQGGSCAPVLESLTTDPLGVCKGTCD